MRTKSISVFCYCILFVFILASSRLFADVDTLKRIAEGESDVAYIGLRLKTTSTSSGSRTVEEVVIHRNAEDSYRKFVSIIGAPKALAEENDAGKKQVDRNRDTRNRRGREFRWQHHRSQFSIKEIELIAQNYALELRHWGENIAGHQTDLLIIKPKHANRSTKHIYFARKNGVILRVEDLDAAGILRNMFVYNRISFEQNAVETKWKNLQKEINPQPRHNRPRITLAEAEEILKKKPIQPTYIPQGFQLQGLYKRHFRGIHIQLKYTDGLLDINLFETTDKVRPSERPVIKIGGTSVREYQRVPDYAFGWKSDGVNFFISGPIPPAELQKVVESIILKKDKK